MPFGVFDMMHVCMYMRLWALWGLGTPQKLKWPPRWEKCVRGKPAPQLPKLQFGRLGSCCCWSEEIDIRKQHKTTHSLAEAESTWPATSGQPWAACAPAILRLKENDFWFLRVPSTGRLEPALWKLFPD